MHLAATWDVIELGSTPGYATAPASQAAPIVWSCSCSIPPRGLGADGARRLVAVQVGTCQQKNMAVGATYDAINIVQRPWGKLHVVILPQQHDEQSRSRAGRMMNDGTRATYM